MSEITLTAALRTEFGKGAARRIRRAHAIPAVLYGHGRAPVHLSLPGHETFLAIKGQANPLVSLAIEGGTTELALVKDIQRDPIRPVIEHLDLVLVRRGEKVSVEVPLVVVGEPVGSAVASLDLQSLKVQADATLIPAQLEVSVEGLGEGTVLRAADVLLPEGTTLEGDPETVVLSVATPALEEEEPEAAAAAPVEVGLVAEG